VIAGANDVLAVYASGRRLHELMTLSDWRVAQTTFLGSPVIDEATAAQVRYRHFTSSPASRQYIVTHVLDAWLLQEARHLDHVYAIAPAIVIAEGNNLTDRGSLSISTPRYSSSERIDRGFERVPRATADTLSAGLETRENHALGRLAYQMACSGLDISSFDAAAVSVHVSPDQIVATYASQHENFQVVLNDTGTTPMTLWAGTRQLYSAPHFSGCAVDYLIECTEAFRGRATGMCCDELYLDILSALRRAVATAS
jgi:hypothetical protein